MALSSVELKEMIEEEREEMKEKAIKVQQKLDDRLKRKEGKKIIIEAHSCKGTTHADGEVPTWKPNIKGSTRWLWCSFCNTFGICPECIDSDREMLQEHEEEHDTELNE